MADAGIKLELLADLEEKGVYLSGMDILTLPSLWPLSDAQAGRDVEGIMF